LKLLFFAVKQAVCLFVTVGGAVH